MQGDPFLVKLGAPKLDIFLFLLGSLGTAVRYDGCLQVVETNERGNFFYKVTHQDPRLCGQYSRKYLAIFAYLFGMLK